MQMSFTNEFQLNVRAADAFYFHFSDIKLLNNCWAKITGREKEKKPFPIQITFEYEERERNANEKNVK